jgi:acyl-CoA synthetase (AMP-forming)/AMP-acid ligase II
VAEWNFADIFEAVADAVPDVEAQVHGDRRLTWAETDSRADGVARALLAGGAVHQDKVALYLYNGIEYLETCLAAWKAGLVPINTNYRYTADELVYLWDNADTVAVVFHGSFTATIEAVRGQLDDIRTWLWVDDGSGACPGWATPYEDGATATGDPVRQDSPRSGEDLLMLYTGGTTGMPKGVMWQQHDLVRGVVGGVNEAFKTHEADYDAVQAGAKGGGMRHISACPLMHGTGWFTALMTLATGGCVITTPSRHYDAAELMDVIDAEAANTVAIVGDAFARPMVRALDAESDRWELSSLLALISSGVMWSEEVKEAFLAHAPHVICHDTFSSSEALGMGSSLSSGDDAPETAKFALGVNAVVVADDGSKVEPGSGVRGRVAVGGVTPIGYYKDEAKSAATFVEIDGHRYSMPGDYATVEADGSLTLLGRGSVCINTGGEKVFPEEVEEALKRHPAVMDAVAVGVPDEKFGEAVTAVVESEAGAEIDEAAIIAEVRQHLAGYKSPKRVLTIDTIGRAPNGKVDYKRLKKYAADQLGLTQG